MIQVLRREAVDTVSKAFSASEYVSRDRLILHDAEGAEVAVYRLSAVEGWSVGPSGRPIKTVARNA